MNLRPSGYEPDELPDCSTPRHELEELQRIWREPLIGQSGPGQRRPARQEVAQGCIGKEDVSVLSMHLAGPAATYSPAS